jgi:iron complex outermembrane receptor protein
LAPPGRALTGDGSLSYFIASSGTKLRAHAGNAYRAPGLPERFGGGFSGAITGVGTFTPYGDPFLSPDRYNSVDGGLDQYLWRDRVRVSSTYFYTRIVTVTAFDSSGSVINPATDPYGRTQGYINGSGGISRGAEFNVESRPTRDLTLAGSYTYTRANTDRDIEVSGFFRMMRIARHSFTLMGTQQIGKRLNLTVDVTGKGEFFSSFFTLGRSRVFRYPRTTKTDLSASYALKQNDAGAVKLYTRIENMFNRSFYDGNVLVGYRAPGTTFVTGVSFQY